MSISNKILKTSLCALVLGVTTLVAEPAFAGRGGPGHGGTHNGNPGMHAGTQNRRRPPNQPNLVNNRRENRIDNRGNDNGVVDRGDFGRGQQARGEHPNLVNNRRENRIDNRGNDNGVVDRGDFGRGQQQAGNKPKGPKGEGTDSNGDGKVNRFDNEKFVEEKSKNSAPWMFKADTNQDGRVDKNELATWKQNSPQDGGVANKANTPLERKIDARHNGDGVVQKVEAKKAAEMRAAQESADTVEETVTE